MKLQKGSAHVIIVITLVVVVVGLLSFIFWQNFIVKDSEIESNEKLVAKQDEKMNEPVSEDAAAIPDGFSAYKDEMAGFSMAYPEEWGVLAATATRPDSTRLGSSGVNTKALADSGNSVRVEVYTKDSYIAKMASGYTVRYKDGKVVGADAGSDVYGVLIPIAGTNVYAHDYGDAGFSAYDLFFDTGDSVVYVYVGSSKDTQSQIAKTVKVY